MYTTIYMTFSVITFLTTPCLCMLAYRAWTKSIRQSLSQTRSALGITSVALTSLNWLALMCFIAIEKARLHSGFGAYIKSQIAMNQDTFVSVSFLLSVIAVILGVALQKSARIQAVAAGLLLVAFWVVGILGGLN
jgi:hypothetical protein